MTSDTMNDPTPEFRAQLEWEVTRALRREARLGARRGERLRQQLRAASIIVACLTVGVVTGVASAQVRDFARRDSLLESARAELALVALRVQLARSQFDEATRKAKMGVPDAEGLASAEAELRSMETKAARAQLNIEEIRVDAQPPRDELNAPLVGGRDFVKERIQLDLLNAQQRLTAAEAAAELVDRRLRAGAVDSLAGLEAKLEVTRANGTLAVLAERLSLRREFVEKPMPADQLVRRAGIAQARQDVLVAQQALELANARAKLVERKRSIGVATDLDLMRAQVEVKERELGLAQLVYQLRQISKGT